VGKDDVFDFAPGDQPLRRRPNFPDRIEVAVRHRAGRHLSSKTLVTKAKGFKQGAATGREYRSNRERRDRRPRLQYTSMELVLIKRL
jgi:hypothetical protein